VISAHDPSPHPRTSPNFLHLILLSDLPSLGFGSPLEFFFFFFGHVASLQFFFNSHPQANFPPAFFSYWAKLGPSHCSLPASLPVSPQLLPFIFFFLIFFLATQTAISRGSFSFHDTPSSRPPRFLIDSPPTARIEVRRSLETLFFHPRISHPDLQWLFPPPPRYSHSIFLLSISFYDSVGTRPFPLPVMLFSLSSSFVLAGFFFPFPIGES